MMLYAMLAQPQQLRLLILADIHYNDTYDDFSAPLARFGRDTSAALLNITVDYIKKLNEQQHFDAILIPGDLTGHAMTTKKEVMSSIKYVAQQVNNIGVSDIVTILGNNEGSGNGNQENLGDYNFSLTIDDPFYKDLSNAMGNLIPSDSRTEFLHWGYYSHVLDAFQPNKDTQFGALKIIALNSGYWANDLYKEYHPNLRIADPANELQYLFEQLEITRQNQQTAIIFMHEPAGMNGKNAKVTNLDNFTTPFMDILMQYQDVVMGIFAGHYHWDMPKLYSDQIWLKDFIAISTRDENNPGFEIVDLGFDGVQWQMKDYEVHYLDVYGGNLNYSSKQTVSYFKNYRFSEKYSDFIDKSSGYISNTSFKQYIGQMRSNALSFEVWYAAEAKCQYKEGKTGEICGISSQNKTEFDLCAQNLDFEGVKTGK